MKAKQLQSLRNAIRIIERHVDNQLKDQKLCCGISLAQCHALLEIGAVQNITIAELADRLNLDKSTLSRTIDNLVQHSLVNREIDAKDRRYMLVSLTESGQTMVDGIHASSNGLYRDICKHIPSDKLESVLEGVELFSKAIVESKNGKVDP